MNYVIVLHQHNLYIRAIITNEEYILESNEVNEVHADIGIKPENNYYHES